MTLTGVWGAFVCVFLPTYFASRCVQGRRPRFTRQVGFGREDQDLVSASATAKHASCCRCVKRRPGILDRDRQLPSSRPFVHSFGNQKTRPRRGDGEAEKPPY